MCGLTGFVSCGPV
ncbi:MAG: hypothetical protein LAP13_26865, partial [Acidobacteriia bacterium]|nr:hypothetical protein [Terriglobia bacterium]